MAAVYVPRSPTTGVLYAVVRTHLSELLAAVAAQTDGSGLPGFVVGEFRKFLRCGVLAHGFARVRCGDCAFERLVPFSCKGRAICHRRYAHAPRCRIGSFACPVVHSARGT